MHAVVFEVLPKPERRDEYLAIAAALRPELERIDGFLSVERFASREHEGKILSFSLWRDEAALVRWRSHREHRSAQDKGRFEIFRDYRLRVGAVVRTVGAAETSSSPAHGGRGGDARPCAAILEIDPSVEGATEDWGLTEERGNGLVAREAFSSLYTEGKTLVLTSWADARRAETWVERMAAAGGGGYRLRVIAVERDYGPCNRAEAPVREPAVER